MTKTDLARRVFSVLPPREDLGTLAYAMDVSSLPHSFERLLTRGVVPQASLIVGGTRARESDLIQRIQVVLSVAAADTLILPQPPTIAELRTILGRLVQTPYQSPATILALARFETWSEELATVLLKTLEEPPAHARIVLFASDAAHLLPTIRSRVAEFRFGPADESPSLTREDLPETLAARFGWSQLATADATPHELLAPELTRLDPHEQRIVLDRLTSMSHHPVNKRLAVDAILTRLGSTAESRRARLAHRE